MSCPSIKQVNRRKSEGKSSQYFGVYWHKPKRKWRAVMRQKGRQVYLGSCTTEKDAATLYILKASQFYGQQIRKFETT